MDIRWIWDIWLQIIQFCIVMYIGILIPWSKAQCWSMALGHHATPALGPGLEPGALVMLGPGPAPNGKSSQAQDCTCPVHPVCRAHCAGVAKCSAALAQFVLILGQIVQVWPSTGLCLHSSSRSLFWSTCRVWEIFSSWTRSVVLTRLRTTTVYGPLHNQMYMECIWANIPVSWSTRFDHCDAQGYFLLKTQ